MDPYQVLLCSAARRAYSNGMRSRALVTRRKGPVYAINATRASFFAGINLTTVMAGFPTSHAAFWGALNVYMPGCRIRRFGADTSNIEPSNALGFLSSRLLVATTFRLAHNPVRFCVPAFLLTVSALGTRVSILYCLLANAASTRRMLPCG